MSTFVREVAVDSHHGERPGIGVIRGNNIDVTFPGKPDGGGANAAPDIENSLPRLQRRPSQ